MAWHPVDLSAVTGAPPLAGDPDGYMFDAQGTQHVVYRGTDNHVHELWWEPQGGWHHVDLSAVTGAPASAGDPDGYMFDAQGTQHVVYRGTDNHVHELWWEPQGGWHPVDLSAVTGAPPLAGDPDGYMFDAQGTQHVVYRGTDNHVHELWWEPQGGWHPVDLSAVTGAPLLAGDPDGYMFDAQGTQHVVYRGTDNHVHELWWEPQGGWHHVDLSAVTGAPASAGDPDGYMFDAQGTQHVVYRGTDNHVHELWWEPQGGWHHVDLSAVTGAPASAGDPDGYMFDAQGTQHVVYRGTDNHVHELWWEPQGGWHPVDLSAVTGAPPLAGDPDGYMFDAQGTQHVVYRGTDNHVHELWWVPATPGQVFTRREVWGLEATMPFDQITLAYAKAVQVMQARPTSDPTSWNYQAGIHGAFSVPPPGSNWNQCQHQSWYFLPWHRMYLYFFERIVRKAVVDAGGPVDFALPYWNYDRAFPANTLPPAFRAPTLPDGTANPLYVPAPGRNAALMAGGQLPSTATSSAAAMASIDFSLPSLLPTFGGGRVGPAHFGGAVGLLESSPHNVMHPTIGGAIIGQCGGGLMSDPNCAALDPIFWLHHANIDRLWNNWLAFGAGRSNPNEAPWLQQSFVFCDESGAQVSMTCGDVLDSAAQLDYVYDDALPSMSRVSAGTGVSPNPPEPPELAGATEHEVLLSGNAVTTTLVLPQTSRATIRSASEERRRFVVTIDDIEAEEDPGLAYAVYLSTASRERQHIGNVAFFGIREMRNPDRAHDGAPGFRHSFDATQAIINIGVRQVIDGGLEVTFDPIRVLAPPDRELPREVAETGEVRPVRIGRVSLFVS